MIIVLSLINLGNSRVVGEVSNVSTSAVLLTVDQNNVTESRVRTNLKGDTFRGFDCLIGLHNARRITPSGVVGIVSCSEPISETITVVKIGKFTIKAKNCNGRSDSGSAVMRMSIGYINAHTESIAGNYRTKTVELSSVSVANTLISCRSTFICNIINGLYRPDHIIITGIQKRICFKDSSQRFVGGTHRYFKIIQRSNLSGRNGRYRNSSLENVIIRNINLDTSVFTACKCKVLELSDHRAFFLENKASCRTVLCAHNFPVVLIDLDDILFICKRKRCHRGYNH